MICLLMVMSRGASKWDKGWSTATMIDKQKLLDAHVKFELQRWQGEALRSMIVEEVEALYAWLATVRLNEVVQPAQVVAFIRRTVIDTPISPEAIDSIRESVQVVFELLREDATPIEAIAPRALYDRVAESVIGMEALRREVTHQVVASPVYTTLLSNVLYQGIKGYALSDNALSRKIPGASSLVRFSQSALSSAAPQLEKAIDRQLTAFIHDNLHEIIVESERFLNNALNEKALRAVADDLWAANAQTTMATIAGYTDAALIDDAVALIRDFWLHVRQTPLFLEIVEQLVRNVFLRHGKKTVAALLAELSVTPALIADEVYAFAAPTASSALQSGYLEQRIRARLAAFYDSCEYLLTDD
jgi:hypothetical protein